MVFWVFGYGSLVWNPGFQVDDKVIGYIKDYRRVFDLGMFFFSPKLNISSYQYFYCNVCLNRSISIRVKLFMSLSVVRFDFEINLGYLLI